MLILNLQNIENLIFTDVNLRKLLPDLRHIFDQWLMSVRLPYLRSLKLRSFADFLNEIGEKHIKVLEDYFQDTVILERINTHIIKHMDCPLNELPNIEFSNFAISRDSTQLYISAWR